MLTLYEDLAILSLNTLKNTFSSSDPSLHYIISASIIVELSIKKKIRKDTNGCIEVIDLSDSGDPVLDDALHRITASKRTLTLQEWIQQLMYRMDPLKRASASLEKKQIIRQEREWRFIFPVQRWYLTNPGVQESLKFKIALTEEVSRNERIAGLISLVMAGESALKHLFRQEEWDDLRTRFKQFIVENPLPQTVKDLLYKNSSADDLTLVLLLGAMGTDFDSSGGDSGGDGGGGDGGD
jgi:Golgi phosphoprotein 3